MTSMVALEDIVARIGIKMEELAESQKGLADSHKDTERVLKEQNAETDRILTDKISGLSDKISAMSDRISALSDEVNKWVGHFGNSIGNIVEMILIPGIKLKINDFGHNFNSLAPRKQYYYKDGKTLTEVDLFLENGDEAMAVEVKTHLTLKDVNYHLRRLKLLRENESEAHLTGKTLYSAVAGFDIDLAARERASGLGMYIVEMVESTKYVNVIKPSVELGKW